MGQRLFGYAFPRKEPPLWLMETVRHKGILSLQRPFIDLAPGDVLRWKLATQFFLENPTLRDRISWDNVTKDLHLGLPNLNFIWKDNISYSVSCTFLFSGLFYGCIHLAAWNAPFRTATESLLWRASGVCLTGSGMVPVTCQAIYFSKSKDFWVNIIKRVRRILNTPSIVWPFAVAIYLILTLSMAGVVYFYIFARFYLVVESVLALPYLPSSTLKIPQWSQYFIHFT